MKKLLFTLAVFGVVADAAQAQTNVTIYGRMDIGLVKKSEKSFAIGRGDNNVLGFKGTEDLGGGLSALFQSEMRFEPDTGTVESGNRPLFQGQSRVGLSGAFGTIRLGRGLTAVQDPNVAYDPFVTKTVGSLIDQVTAKYDSGPGVPGNGARFSNALFYNSPVVGGFQANATIASKEGIATSSGLPGATSTTQLPSNPYSLSGTYNNGPVSALLGYESNTVETKFWQAAGSYKFGAANLMASYAQQKNVQDVKTKGWGIGADIVAGPGSVKIGYGETHLDQHASDKKGAIGYWYNLSQRTYLYTDAARTKNGDTGDAITAFDIGIRHTF